MLDGGALYHQQEAALAKLYLDELDRVRFDPTPDDSIARRASIGRGLAALSDTTVRLILACERVRSVAGIPASEPVIDDLEILWSMRRDILRRACQREDA